MEEVTSTILDNQTGRIKIQESLLANAIANDAEALEIIFHQFVPEDETIKFAEYYGYFGFAFVGFHSFSCLTEKRIATLRIGPFKKILYEDGFYENMTSGGIYQPSKFWLYVFLILGIVLGFAAATTLVSAGLGFMSQFLGLPNIPLLVISGIISIFSIPFIGNFITMLFYRFNPCGLACWIRQRTPVYVYVNRGNMMKANRLYRLWSSLREDRLKHMKSKLK